jgi:hypothetical protein
MRPERHLRLPVCLARARHGGIIRCPGFNILKSPTLQRIRTGVDHGRHDAGSFSVGLMSGAARSACRSLRHRITTRPCLTCPVVRHSDNVRPSFGQPSSLVISSRQVGGGRVPAPSTRMAIAILPVRVEGAHDTATPGHSRPFYMGHPALHPAAVLVAPSSINHGLEARPTVKRPSASPLRCAATRARVTVPRAEAGGL